MVFILYIQIYTYTEINELLLKIKYNMVGNVFKIIFGHRKYENISYLLLK